MNTKTKWQIRRERGRGRKLFWGIVLVFAIVSLMSVAHGFGRERGRSHFGGGSTHGSTIENPVELREGLSRALDYLDVTDEQEAAVETLVEELSPELWRWPKARTRFATVSSRPCPPRQWTLRTSRPLVPKERQSPSVPSR